MISRDSNGPDGKPENLSDVPGCDDGESLGELDGDRLKATIEAILFASPEPVSRRRLHAMLREAPKDAVKKALLELEAELITTPRGYLLHEGAGGLRLLTKPEFAPFVARLRGGRRRIRLSSAAFETLAVIAYRQPVRRSDLEAVRGVQCGPILKNLMEWGLVRVVGQEESIGRPLLYGTTTEFLELLGLSGLDALPEPERLRQQGADRGLEILDDLLSEDEPEDPDGGGPDRADETSSGKSAEATVAPVVALDSDLPPDSSSKAPVDEDLDDWVPDDWDGK